jgi:hypothetical protein
MFTKYFKTTTLLSFRDINPDSKECDIRNRDRKSKGITSGLFPRYKNYSLLSSVFLVIKDNT